jgi:hypothetical protein
MGHLWWFSLLAERAHSDLSPATGFLLLVLRLPSSLTQLCSCAAEPGGNIMLLLHRPRIDCQWRLCYSWHAVLHSRIKACNVLAVTNRTLATKSCSPTAIKAPWMVELHTHHCMRFIARNRIPRRIPWMRRCRQALRLTHHPCRMSTHCSGHGSRHTSHSERERARHKL